MRVKRGFTSRRRHKKVIGLAKGHRGRRGNAFKLSKHSVQKALQYAYRDRRVKKREFRGLWIVRINASARALGLTYSKLMLGLRKSDIDLDRKVLAELAVNDPDAFAAMAEKAKSALNA